MPYDPELRPAPGSIVQPSFWRYINRVDLFPGGWLHDVGLPMTDAFTVSAYKNGEWRPIVIQVFERTVLTYDAKNPPNWQIERGNIGAERAAVGAVAVGPGRLHHRPPHARAGAELPRP